MQNLKRLLHGVFSFNYYNNSQQMHEKDAVNRLILFNITQ